MDKLPAMDRVLALDVGGTKVEAGLVSVTGEVLSRERIRTEGRDGESLYASVLALCMRVLARSDRNVLGCGVGCGGPGRDRYQLVSPLNIAIWRDFPLAARLADDLGLPVEIENDGKAFALGEGWKGAAIGCENFIAMVVSTGVGGGIVLNGKLLDGADGNAGHIGHVFVDPAGGTDAGGVAGLLEGSASGSAIEVITGAPPELATSAVRQGVGLLVGRAVASVANLLDLQLAIVGGSVALGYGIPFFAAAQATIDDLTRLDHSRGTRIIPAGLGADGPLIGAAAVALRSRGLDQGS